MQRKRLREEFFGFVPGEFKGLLLRGVHNGRRRKWIVQISMAYIELESQKYIHKYIFTHMLDSVQLHAETHVIVVGLLLRMV